MLLYFSPVERKQILAGELYKAELTDRIFLFFQEVNAKPVVFHRKYNLDDINISVEVIVDTLPLNKSG